MERSRSLVEGLAPGHADTATLVVRRLTSVRCRKVVNAENVTFLPSAENHVLVDGGADLIHLLESNRGAVAKGGI